MAANVSIRMSTCNTPAAWKPRRPRPRAISAPTRSSTWPTSASARWSSRARSCPARGSGQVELAEQLGISRTPGARGAAPADRRGPRRVPPQPRVPGGEPGPGRRAAPAGGPLAAGARDRAARRRAPHATRPRRAAATRSRASWRPRRGSPRTTPAATSTSRSRAPPATRSSSAVIESLWIVEIGRRLLAARATSAGWKDADVAEHRGILDRRRRPRRRARRPPHGRAHRRGAAALGARGGAGMTRRRRPAGPGARSTSRPTCRRSPTARACSPRSAA